jgi:hypothetical protein
LNQTALKSLLTLWNSQGLFQGDCNRVQQYCKSWVIVAEGDQKIDLLKIQTLAQNPDVYKALFEETQFKGTADDEWKSISPEEADHIFSEIEKFQAQRDSL